jgi:segregation and condensation protein B
MTEIEKKIINIIFASGEGIDTNNIVKILSTKKQNGPELEINKEKLEESILNIKKNMNNIGLELVVSENNNSKLLSITTSPDSASILESYFKIQTEEDLTPAQLQTLTIVAYLKEVSVQEVSFIRGVQSIQTLRALSTRGLVKKIGEKYFLTLEAFKILGISINEDLKDFEKLSLNLRSKLSEALNG